MPPRSSRLRRFLLLTAAAVAVTLCVTAVSAKQHQKVSVDISAPEPDANGVTVPEFVATNEWQELLPGQGVPRVSVFVVASALCPW